eukprot:TRINITY_DN929_c0_g1_i1.p1 TRINITY_DN929_c0_g1~~TRINITY_DN929_c0_g1_i1.p1  ORF type:complete len:535 (+),score=187.55 TRINITY_DN929_c0_g1_i1:103-1707(+)
MPVTPALADKPVQQDTEPFIKSYWWPRQDKIEMSEAKTGYTHLYRIYKSAAQVLLLAAVCAAVYFYLESTSGTEDALAELSSWYHQERSLAYEAIFILSLISVVVWYYTREKDIYLLDFEVWGGRKDWEFTMDEFCRGITKAGIFSQEAIDFQSRLCRRSGLGDQTYISPDPLQLHPKRSAEEQRKEYDPSSVNGFAPKISMINAREEFATVVFPVVESVLKRNNISPTDIDILVVNCSLLCPTPSLSSIVVNHFRMRSNILSFNLGGMGCSAGVLALDLAKDMLKVHKNSRALVISTESLTLHGYTGSERSFMLQNAIFRCGSAAMILTNKPSDIPRAKYQLQHVVRVHRGSDNLAYGVVYLDNDDDNNTGVRITKDLMKVAGDALKHNMTKLGPLVLPLSEKLKFAKSLLVSKLYKLMGKKAPQLYVPDFKKAFNHFCIHAGGRAIIDGLEKSLNLNEEHVEPSRATLYRYGNTSSSSVWYELYYSQNMGYIKKGDIIWQIALGSGFKCNSAVWKAMRSFPAIGTPPQAKTQ